MGSKTLEFNFKMRQAIIEATHETSDIDVLRDALSEVACELTNDRYTTNDERVEGILESLEMIFNIDLIN